MIRFAPVYESWHCNACSARNYGGEDADLYELEIGNKDYSRTGICLCRECALEVATAISNALFDNAEQEE